MWNLLQHSDWQIVVQLILDALLLILVASLLWHRRRQSPSSSLPHAQVIESFERILAETKTLSEEFDRNLRERGRLIQNVLEALDAKLSEAHAILKTLNEGAAQPSASTTKPDQSSKTLVEKILQLADAGRSPQEIAARIHRPLGEVELILGLHRLQQKK